MINSTKFIKIVSSILVVTFLFLQVSWAYPESVNSLQRLSGQSIFTESMMNEIGNAYKGTIFEEIKLLSAVYLIGELLLGQEDIDKPLDIKYLEPILKSFVPEEYLKGIKIENIVPVELLLKERREDFIRSLEELGFGDAVPEKGVVYIPYNTPEGEHLLIQIARKDSEELNGLEGYTLPPVFNKYALVVQDEKYKKRKFSRVIENSLSGKMFVKKDIPEVLLSKNFDKALRISNDETETKSLPKVDNEIKENKTVKVNWIRLLLRKKVCNYFFSGMLLALMTIFFVACGGGGGGTGSDMSGDDTAAIEEPVKNESPEVHYDFYESGRVHFKIVLKDDQNGTPNDLSDDIPAGTEFEYTDEDVIWYGDMNFGFLIKQTNPDLSYKEFLEYFNKNQPRYVDYYYVVNNGISDGEARSRRYEYDFDGRLLLETRFDGSYTEYLYYGETDTLHYVLERDADGVLLIEYTFDNNGEFIDKTGEEILYEYYEPEHILKSKTYVITNDSGTEDPSDDIPGGTKYEYDRNGNSTVSGRGTPPHEETLPFVPEGDVDLLGGEYSWYVQEYGDRQGFDSVEIAGKILDITCDLKGLDSEISQGEAAVRIAPMDLSKGKKIIMRIKVPEEFVGTGMNGVMIFARDNKRATQYERWKNIKHADEWLDLEYMPTSEDIDGQGYTFDGFNPANITEIGIKIAISCVSDRSFQGDIQLTDIKIVDTDEVIEAAKKVDMYKKQPVIVEPVSGEEFYMNSGASFYFPGFELCVGTESGISSNEDEIRELFENMSVETARVWLSLGSGRDSGIEYSRQGYPIGFKNKDLAVKDLIALVRIAKSTNTRLVLVLHNSDLAEEHRDVLDAEDKTEAMVEIERMLLSEVFARLGSDQYWISSIEPMSEPDNANTFLSNTQRFLLRVIDMVRETTGKPINMGPGKKENTGYLSWMLEDGDFLQYHWYKEKGGVQLFDYLKQNIGQLDLPEGVKVIIGEAQPNIGSRSIIPGAIAAAREAGAFGVYFWFDNKDEPEFVCDYDLLIRNMVGLKGSVDRSVEFPEGIPVSSGIYAVKTSEYSDGHIKFMMVYDEAGDLLAEKRYDASDGVIDIKTFSQSSEIVSIPEIAIDGQYTRINTYNASGELLEKKFYEDNSLKFEEEFSSGKMDAIYKWSETVNAETGRACLVREKYNSNYVFVEATMHSFDGKLLDGEDGGSAIDNDGEEGIERYLESNRIRSKQFPDGTILEYYDESFYDNGTPLIPEDDFGRVSSRILPDGKIEKVEAYFVDTDEYAKLIIENGEESGTIFYFRDQAGEKIGYRWEQTDGNGSLDFRLRDGEPALYHKIDRLYGSEYWFLWDQDEDVDVQWEDLAGGNIFVVAQKDGAGDWYKFPFKSDSIDKENPFVYWDKGLVYSPLNLSEETLVSLPEWPTEGIELRDGDLLSAAEENPFYSSTGDKTTDEMDIMLATGGQEDYAIRSGVLGGEKDLSGFMFLGILGSLISRRRSRVTSGSKNDPEPILPGSNKIPPTDVMPDNPLMTLVDDTVTSERLKLIIENNELIGHLNLLGIEGLKVPDAMDKETALTAVVENVNNFLDVLRGFDIQDPGILKEMDVLDKDLSILVRIGLVGVIVSLGKSAGKAGQKVIIGLETDWIPGYDEKDILEHSVLNPLMIKIKSLGESLAKLGIRNVHIVTGSGEDLAGKLLEKATEESVKLSNIVVLAKERTIDSDSFIPLRSTELNEKAFLAGISKDFLDNFEKDLQAKQKEKADKFYLRVDILKILLLTLELATGKVSSDNPLIQQYDKNLRRAILLPKMELVEYDVLKTKYELDIIAIKSL